MDDRAAEKLGPVSLRVITDANRAAVESLRVAPGQEGSSTMMIFKAGWRKRGAASVTRDAERRIDSLVAGRLPAHQVQPTVGEHPRDRRDAGLFLVELHEQ